MSASLVKVSQTNIVSGDSSITITGLDNEFEVYFMQLNNIKPLTDAANLYMRVTQSGTADSTAIYDYAFNEAFDNSATIIDTGYQNNTVFIIGHKLTTDSTHPFNSSLYLFNFPTDSEYSLITQFSTSVDSDGRNRSWIGGGQYKGNSIDDGVYLYLSTGNFDSGQINLYGLRKS
jgi:hypothetical protein